MSDRKKVSICIPAYNNEQAMRRLLASIEMQSYKDYEVILTDDSDTDGIRKLAEEKEYVRYHKNEKRLGATANWNAAIAKSSGEYIKIMHHDDWFTDADSLQRFVDMLEEHPEADMAFCGSRQVETDGNVGEDGSRESHGSSYERFTSKEDIRLIEADYRNLFLGNTIGAPSAVMVRRNTADAKRILYDEKLTWLVDMEYYMHILSENPHFAYTESPLVSIGVGKEQLTEKCRDDKELNVFEYGYIYRKYGLKSEKKYRQKLIQICADAGKTWEVVKAYEISEKEYKAELRRKLYSRIQWKLTHMFNRKQG